ncbi:MAG: hypothetical protein PUB05_02060 [Firmicutes bacterium]|nr:hypothetical protein [Bacillota bacterium]
MRNKRRKRCWTASSVVAVAFVFGLFAAFCLPTACLIAVLAISVLLLGISCAKY